MKYVIYIGALIRSHDTNIDVFINFYQNPHNQAFLQKKDRLT